MEEKCSAAEAAHDISSFISDSPTHDKDHLHDAAIHQALHHIPAFGSSACPKDVNAFWRNHDRQDVTDDCARKQDNSIETKMLVEERIPSRLTEPNQKLFPFGAAVGVQSPKPVAVVHPMRPSASGVSSKTFEFDRPQRSSKSASSELCQTSQPFCTGESSSPSRSPVSPEVAAKQRIDLCASPFDPSHPSFVFFNAKQEQNREFAQQPPTHLSELDLLNSSNFFYGHLSRSKAKSKLRHTADGTFLVRYSSDSKFPFALSIKTPNGVTSVRLARNANGLVRLDCDPGQADRMPAFWSVLDLVVSYVRDETGRRPSHQHCIYLEGVGLSETVLDLKKPFEESPASLGHLCRRKINALVPQHRSKELVQTLVHVTPRNTQNLMEFLGAYPYRV